MRRLKYLFAPWALSLGITLGISGASAATWTVDPGAEGASSLQAVLAKARDGDRIVIREGRYELEPGVKIPASRLTVEGAGSERTVLVFRHNVATPDLRNEPALIVSGNGVSLGNLSVVDAPGPAIAATGVDRLTIRRVAIRQTLGLHANGPSMNIKIFSARNVLLDTVDSRHASVSGAQISQSENVVVRNSHFAQNSTGLEIENDYQADVYNNTIEDNGTGLLFLDTPAYPHTGSHALRAYGNTIVRNNRESVSTGRYSRVNRAGTGVLIMGAVSDVHIFANRISESGHASLLLLATPWKIDGVASKAIPNDVVVRGNVFGRSGFQPLDNLLSFSASGQRLADVIWDGATSYIAGGQVKTDEPLRLTLSDNIRVDGGAATFLSLGQAFANGGMLIADPSRTLPPPARTSEPAAVKLPQDTLPR